MKNKAENKRQRKKKGLNGCRSDTKIKKEERETRIKVIKGRRYSKVQAIPDLNLLFLWGFSFILSSFTSCSPPSLSPFFLPGRNLEIVQNQVNGTFLLIVIHVCVSPSLRKCVIRLVYVTNLCVYLIFRFLGLGTEDGIAENPAECWSIFGNEWFLNANMKSFLVLEYILHCRKIQTFSSWKLNCITEFTLSSTNSSF